MKAVFTLISSFNLSGTSYLIKVHSIAVAFLRKVWKDFHSVDSKGVHFDNNYRTILFLQLSAIDNERIIVLYPLHRKITHSINAVLHWLCTTTSRSKMPSTPHVPLNKHEVLSNISISTHIAYDCCEKLTSKYYNFWVLGVPSWNPNPSLNVMDKMK